MVLREEHESTDQPPPTQRSGGSLSPFIEGTQIQYAWDSTSLEALKRCPQYYKYSIIDNWQTNGDSVHLRFGQEIHTAIEGYERSRAEGIGHDDALHDTIRALLERIQDWNPEPKNKGEERKSKENLLRTIVWYLDYYENDAAKTVILENGKPAVELTFQIELSFGPQSQHSHPHVRGHEASATEQHREWTAKYGWPTTPYLLCGHLDKVVQFSGDLYVMDHKTTTSTPGDYYFDSFSPHNQMSAYSIAAKAILKSPIKGVIIDAIQIADNFSRPQRGFTYRTQDQLEEWLADMALWLRQAEGFAEANYWPKNDTACSMYGGCKFRSICSQSPQVREKWLKAGFTQENERWNPLKPR